MMDIQSDKLHHQGQQWQIKHSCSIRVDRIKEEGCRYIVVMRNDGLHKSNLNANLFYGCHSRESSWNGSCGYIYHDIDNWTQHTSTNGTKLVI